MLRLGFWQSRFWSQNWNHGLANLWYQPCSDSEPFFIVSVDFLPDIRQLHAGLLAATWLISLIPSVLSIEIFTVELRQSPLDISLQPDCVSDFTGWPSIWHQMYLSGVAVIIFVIPLLLFISLHIHIVSEIWTAVTSFNEMVGVKE